jgi:hypothetical protein
VGGAAIEAALPELPDARQRFAQQALASRSHGEVYTTSILGFMLARDIACSWRHP